MIGFHRELRRLIFEELHVRGVGLWSKGHIQEDRTFIFDRNEKGYRKMGGRMSDLPIS